MLFPAFFLWYRPIVWSAKRLLKHLMLIKTCTFDISLGAKMPVSAFWLLFFWGLYFYRIQVGNFFFGNDLLWGLGGGGWSLPSLEISGKQHSDHSTSHDLACNRSWSNGEGRWWRYQTDMGRGRGKAKCRVIVSTFSLIIMEFSLSPTVQWYDCTW